MACVSISNRFSYFPRLLFVTFQIQVKRIISCNECLVFDHLSFAFLSEIQIQFDSWVLIRFSLRCWNQLFYQFEMSIANHQFILHFIIIQLSEGAWSTGRWGTCHLSLLQMSKDGPLDQELSAERPSRTARRSETQHRHPTIIHWCCGRG